MKVPVHTSSPQPSFYSSVTARVYHLLQMFLAPLVVFESPLIGGLDLAQITPEFLRRPPVRLLLPALAVTLPVDVRLQHLLAAAFDLAELTHKHRSFSNGSGSNRWRQDRRFLRHV